MSVQISRVGPAGSFTGFGDLGDATSDELDKRIGGIKGSPADYLTALVLLLESAGIAEKLATTGSDSVKSLIGRTRNRANQLQAYQGKAPPDWLFSQTRQDLVETVKTAQAAGLDGASYLRAARDIMSAAVKAADKATSTAVTVKGGGSAAPAPGGVVPEHPVLAGQGSGVVAFIKDNALPIAIIGLGTAAVITIAILDRRRGRQMSGLAGVRRRRRHSRRR